MKLPGPDHPITITPAGKHVRVTADDLLIADSRQALSLQEADYPAVLYIPRADAEMALLSRTDRVTYCPYKGDAHYYSIKAGDRVLDNAVWSYETPYPAMAAIKDYVAFYPGRVKIEQD